MGTHRTSLLAAALAAAAALAPTGSARAGERPDAATFTPALAAFADHSAGARAAGPAPALAASSALVSIPALVAAGQGAIDAAGGAPLASEEAPAVGARDETQRWVPSFGFVSGIVGQRAEGSIHSDSAMQYNLYARQDGTALSCAQNPPPPFGGCQETVPSIFNVTRSIASGKIESFTPPSVPPPGFHPFFDQFNIDANVLPVSGDELFLTPFVGTTTELMTPGLQDVPGRPRLFVHGDLSLAFAFDRNVAKEGVPKGAEFPSAASVDPSLPPVIPPGSTLVETRPGTFEVQVKGTGSKVSGEVQTLLTSAGIGAAFTLDVFERRLRIKPSFDYMQQDVAVHGNMIRAFQADTGLSPGIPLDSPTGCVDNCQSTTQINGVFIQPIRLDADKTRTYRGIGPGLELEMDAARAGPVMLSLFLGGQAYRMLGDLDVHLADTVTVPADGTYVLADQEVSADWDYHMHAWAYRGGVGLRFRWLPED